MYIVSSFVIKISYQMRGNVCQCLAPSRSLQGKHVLLAGGVVALHSLNTFAPPISILVKAGAEESIRYGFTDPVENCLLACLCVRACYQVDASSFSYRTFGPSNLSPAEIHMMYTEAKSMEEQYKNEFTGVCVCVCVFMVFGYTCVHDIWLVFLFGHTMQRGLWNTLRALTLKC